MLCFVCFLICRQFWLNMVLDCCNEDGSMCGRMGAIIIWWMQQVSAGCSWFCWVVADDGDGRYQNFDCWCTGEKINSYVDCSIFLSYVCRIYFLVLTDLNRNPTNSTKPFFKYTLHMYPIITRKKKVGCGMQKPITYLSPQEMLTVQLWYWGIIVLYYITWDWTHTLPRAYMMHTNLT